MDQAQHRISRPHLTCREGRLINTFATPDIDEDAVRLHGLDGCSRHQLVCAWCVWSGDDDIVTPGHHVDNLFWREDAVVLVATCRAVGVTQAVVWGICVACVCRSRRAYRTQVSAARSPQPTFPWAQNASPAWRTPLPLRQCSCAGPALSCGTPWRAVRRPTQCHPVCSSTAHTSVQLHYYLGPTGRGLAPLPHPTMPMTLPLSSSTCRGNARGASKQDS